jgi:hypothetical protein
MINNGSVHYNNDKDGADTQLGGSDAGCELKVRNKEHDTQILIRYVGDVLTVRIFSFILKLHVCLGSPRY